MGGRGRSSGGGGQAAQQNTAQASTQQGGAYNPPQQTEYGTLVRVFDPIFGHAANYEKEVMPTGQDLNYYRDLYDTSIIKDAANQLGVRTADVEFDKNSGLVTVWTGADPSANGFTQPSKVFYDTKLTLKQKTTVWEDGRVLDNGKDYVGVKLTYAGEDF